MLFAEILVKIIAGTSLLVVVGVVAYTVLDLWRRRSFKVQDSKFEELKSKESESNVIDIRSRRKNNNLF